MNSKFAVLSFSAFILMVAFQAAAEDAICNNATSEIHKLSDSDRAVTNSMSGIKPTYQAKVADGFLYGGESGILFGENKITSWGDGDLLVIHPKESEEQVKNGETNPTKFFIQYEEAPYNGPKDVGTKGGIYKVSSTENGITCSKDAKTYAHHFFPKDVAAAGDLYCVRTRSGEGYALMRVKNICGNGIIFDYKFNGASNQFKPEAASAPGTLASTRSNRARN